MTALQMLMKLIDRAGRILGRLDDLTGDDLNELRPDLEWVLAILDRWDYTGTGEERPKFPIPQKWYPGCGWHFVDPEVQAEAEAEYRKEHDGD